MQNKVLQLLWSRYELNCDGYFFGDELVWPGLNWGLIAVWYELSIVELALVWIAKCNELSCVSYLAAIENGYELRYVCLNNVFEYLNIMD